MHIQQFASALCSAVKLDAGASAPPCWSPLLAKTMLALIPALIAALAVVGSSRSLVRTRRNASTGMELHVTVGVAPSMLRTVFGVTNVSAGT